jgi:hypothetical protein
MAERRLKKGSLWELRANFEDGRILFFLRANSGAGDYGSGDDIGLSSEEWDELVAWVNWQRASERSKTKSEA